jgi:UDPglucose--hexose-1-phosphate uridylyltransferase
VKKTTTLLADGRELHYFDSDDAPARVAEDERVLPAQGAVSEIRRDALTDEWVVVASHRQDRTHLPAAVDCPLCPTRDGHRTEIPDDDYEVVVFTNRFPSLSTTPAREPLPQTPWSERRPGDGRCEVVCFTPDHDGAFSRLAPDRLRTVVEVWVDRTCELSALPEVEEVFVFENRGVEIGVTLHHPHGQIYGYPFVTPRTAQLQASAARYAERHDGACVACDVLAEEGAGPRVVARTPGWVAYVPVAARGPFEVHLVPVRHVHDLPGLDEAERGELGPLQADVLARLDAVFGVQMPYMAGWFQAPVRAGRELSHLRLEIISSRRSASKLKYPAASESLMGVFINDVPPERSAALLREARP